MPVAAGADLLAGIPVDEIVVDHVVGPAGYSSGNVIVVQSVAYFPGDDVIGAGGVAADTQSAHQLFAGLLVEGQPAAEDVDSADLLAHQRVVRKAVIRRWSGVSGRGVHRIA